MRDQAESLRAKLNGVHHRKERVTKTLAVVSGKGGVGKSNFSINFSLALSQAGNKVLLFDMDIGMGNIDILMGVSPKFTIVDMFESNIPLSEIIEIAPGGISFIAGGSGFSSIFRFGEHRVHYFIQQLESLFGEYDYVIFDMAAGVSEDSLHIALSADELIVITTPEPTSMTDAYATIKFFSLKEKSLPIHLIVNRAPSDKLAESTHNRLKSVVKQFLNNEFHYLGNLPDDQSVMNAVRNQTPFLLFDPSSKVSKAMVSIMKRYENKSQEEEFADKPKALQFISKIKKLFLER